jgi:hypothetical protein
MKNSISRKEEIEEYEEKKASHSCIFSHFKSSVEGGNLKNILFFPSTHKNA